MTVTPRKAEPLALPVLRRPHDRHRDIPARRLAALSAGGINRRDQDRYIMIKSIRGDTPARPFCIAAS